MTDVVVKRGRRYLLLVAAGLAAVSATAIGASGPIIATDPETAVLTAVGTTVLFVAIYLLLAGLLGWAAFRANRSRVIVVSVVAIVLEASLGLEVLDGAFAFNNHAFAGAHTVALLFFVAVAANALVLLFAALELILGRQGQGTSTSKPGVT